MEDLFDDSVFGGDVDVDDLEESRDDTRFSAWHRPRKHWIRSKQWWHAFEELSNKPEHQRSNYFNVLSLPGGELLDVRYFDSKLNNGSQSEAEKKRIRLTGFVSSQKDFEEAHRNLPLMGISTASGDAVIKNDNIDNLAYKGVLLKTFNNMGPYEVVNLDYCNSVAPPDNERRLQSILKILKYQCQYQSKPWLLMFTTRTAKGAVCSDMFDKLRGVINQNMADSEAFDRIFREHYQENLDALDHDFFDEATERDNSREAVFSDFFILGLLKWLLSNAIQDNVKVKLESVVRYDIEGDEADHDMFSIVLLFKKTGLEGADARGFVTAEAEGGELEDEGVLASRFVRKVKTAKTVESMLYYERDSYFTIARDLAELLEECGKSISHFWDHVCAPEIQAQGWASKEQNLEKN